MKSSLSHLTDQVLLCDLRSLVSRDRATTAELLAHLAEADERRLYLPAAYPSMYLYCVHELHMSEDSALKRIQVARAARKFPAIFEAIADGRLHLSSVVVLAPYLASDNAPELIAAAAHKSKSELAVVLADRFPRPDVPTSVRAIANEQLIPEPPPGGHALGHVHATTGTEIQQAPGHVHATTGTEIQHAPGHVHRAMIAPRSPGRFEVRFTLNQAAHDKLAYARSLLGHAVPSGDVAEVFERGLDTLIERLERRVFAATARTRPPHGRRGERFRPDPGRTHASTRHVPAEVRREVWRRDGGRCTFVSVAGRRCPACTRLEFDHVEPVARGGESTIANLRLRCRAHNQYAAECAFGAGFMDRKRREARGRATRATAGATTEIEHAPGHVASHTATAIGYAPEHLDAGFATKIEHAPGHVDPRRGSKTDEVVPWLRALGFRADEARQGAALCEGVPEATLEERVRRAIAGIGRARFERATRVMRPAG